MENWKKNYVRKIEKIHLNLILYELGFKMLFMKSLGLKRKFRELRKKKME